MQRIVDNGGVFIGGNPSTNTKGTITTADWLNSVQEELAGAIEGLGGVLNPGNNGQLLARLLANFPKIGSRATASVAGTVDAITTAFTPAVAAYLTEPFWWRATGANATTTPTLKQDGLALKTQVKGNNLPLAPGDIPGVGAWMCSQYDATFDKYVLLNPATGIGQTPPVVGTARNLKMSVTAAGANATMIADEAVVESSLGGSVYKIANFNKSVNLAATGPGGMDTGSAPVSGYVSLYAIYNPTTQASALLACNAATSSGSTYSGANMPAGYTASALVSTWATNSSSAFKIGFQVDRNVFFPYVPVLTNGTQTSLTSFSLAAAVPPNAKTFGGFLSITGTTSLSTATSLSISGDASGTGHQQGQVYGNAASIGQGFPFTNIPIITAQTAYYITINPAGNAVNVSSYTI